MAVDLFRIFNETVGALYAEEAAAEFSATRHKSAHALQEILPALAYSITQKANTEAGARNLLDFLRDARVDHSLAQRLGALREAGAYDQLRDSGGYILKYLFGDKLAALTDHVAQTAQLGIGASNELTKITATILISAVARHVAQEGLDAAGLRNALLAQKEAVDARLSGELRQVLGIWADGDSVDPERPPMVTPPAPEPSPIAKILPWLVLLVSALGLLYFVDKGCGEPLKEEQPAVEERPDLPPTERENRVVTLADGTRIVTYRGSFTARFTDAIENHPARLETGFILDEVRFEPDSTTLLPVSYPQLDRLVSILKAYPDIRIRLEGHTDSQGDPAVKLRLSNERARNAMAYLEENGIAADRLRAVGRGPSRPLVREDAMEGDEKNNRIELFAEQY